MNEIKRKKYQNYTMYKYEINESIRVTQCMSVIQISKEYQSNTMNECKINKKEYQSNKMYDCEINKKEYQSNTMYECEINKKEYQSSTDRQYII